MNIKNILITGAGGLVGLNLLSQLKNEHQHIIAIDKNLKRINLIKKIFPEVQAECIDLAPDENLWEHLFVNAETIIQLHAQIHALDTQPYFDNNVHSVAKMIQVAKKYHCKHLIHTSSSVVISVSKDLYVQTKAEGERLVVASGLPYTILRPPLMYGCFDYKHLGLLTALMEKFPLLPFPGHGKYVRQPLYVLDLCRIIQKSMQTGPTKSVHNIIGKEQIYFLDLLKKIKRQRRINCLLMPLPITLFALLVKLWGLLFGKAPFVKDQILALTAGDIFPVDDWESEFQVNYTQFDKALVDIINNPYHNFRSCHEE